MAQGLNGQPVSPVQIFSQRAPTSPWEALRFSPQMDARGIWAVLLALAWLGKRSSAHQTSVERPRNLQIIDPGLLGYLHLEWLPPPSLPTLDQCTVKYKLKYRSTGDADWQVVFTKRLKFGGSFDLGRGAEARVQTLLSGRCVNGSEVQSDWTHATFPAAAHGDPESQIRDFHCVYHNWEQLTCTWRPGRLAPPGARYQLYYWYVAARRAAGPRDTQCARIPATRETGSKAGREGSANSLRLTNPAETRPSRRRD
ncbi:interleukin-13 receptor subunit alpha-2-like isoform X1 [Pelodiscus sinensis]|uniref:interleukin-13 receptor subunit alpha-2-like isoform X1 n=2 Tax=Pelodiscus sinensis TaxID=13735 RepID=UPI003F6AF002